MLCDTSHALHSRSVDPSPLAAVGSKIGAPSPKVGEAMSNEHTRSDDSQLEFTTPNYAVTITSNLEYLFVLIPQSQIAWPAEARADRSPR